MNEINSNKLKLKKLFTNSFVIWKKLWLPVFLIVLAAETPQLIGLGLEAYLYPDIPLNAPLKEHSWLYLACLIFSSICLLFASIATYKVVSEVCQDRPIVWNQVFSSIKNKFWSYLGAHILIGLYAGICFIVAFGFIGLGLALWDKTGLYPNRNIVLTLLIIPCVAALCFTAVRICINYSLTFAAMFVEDGSCRESLERSKALTKGNRWRILGYSVCVFLLSLPLIVLEIIFEYSASLPDFGIYSMLTISWLPILLTLLYLDLKNQSVSNEIVVIEQ